MKELIKQVKKKGTQGDQITKDQVKWGIRNLSTSSAVGVDQWSPAIWRDISEEAPEELIKLLNCVEQEVAWPAHPPCCPDANGPKTMDKNQETPNR